MARTSHSTAPHLIAALDHGTGVVLGQHAVDAQSNEIPAVRDLLAGFDTADLRGSVITLDAMHTQDETAKTILDAGADYVFTVKANRPRLLKALKSLPWKSVPLGSQTTQHGHRRRATRTIKVIEAAGDATTVVVPSARGPGGGLGPGQRFERLQPMRAGSL